MTWDQLTAEQQKQITDLEASAGLPQGILQYADATTTPDWTLLSTNTITESDGSKQIRFCIRTTAQENTRWIKFLLEEEQQREHQLYLQVQLRQV